MILLVLLLVFLCSSKAYKASSKRLLRDGVYTAIVIENCSHIANRHLRKMSIIVPDNCSVVSNAKNFRGVFYNPGVRTDLSFDTVPLCTIDEEYAPCAMNISLALLGSTEVIQLFDTYKNLRRMRFSNATAIMYTGVHADINSTASAGRLQFPMAALRSSENIFLLPEMLEAIRKTQGLRFNLNLVLTRQRGLSTEYQYILDRIELYRREPKPLLYHYVWYGSTFSPMSAIAKAISYSLRNICATRSNSTVYFWYDTNHTSRSFKQFVILQQNQYRGQKCSVQLKAIDIDALTLNTRFDEEYIAAFLDLNEQTKTFPGHFSDLIRNLVLYKYGGWYLDVDTFVRAPFECSDKIVVGALTAENMKVGSAPIFAPQPRMSFFLDAIGLFKTYHDPQVWTSVGSKVTAVLLRYHADICIIADSRIFYPYLDGKHENINYMENSDDMSSYIPLIRNETWSMIHLLYSRTKYADVCRAGNAHLLVFLEAITGEQYCSDDEDIIYS